MPSLLGGGDKGIEIEYDKEKNISYWADWGSQGITKLFCTGTTSQRTNQGRTPSICTLWVPIHLSSNSQQGPPLSSLFAQKYIWECFLPWLIYCSLSGTREYFPFWLKLSLAPISYTKHRQHGGSVRLFFNISSMVQLNVAKLAPCVSPRGTTVWPSVKLLLVEGSKNYI